MTIQEELLPIERGFWTGGADYYTRNLDDECVTVCPENDPYAAAVTSGYVKCHGAWKMVLHQQTPLPAKEPGAI